MLLPRISSAKEALLAGQLFAKKSIDKLISDSENPEHRLKKSLGPWSLTALGIGAIIGSGIFVLTGTAAAGENFQVPSIWHAQVLDVFQNLFQHGSLSGVLMHGRPPAGPAIAISFLLVAVACSFAGLCYAELASMIPIAGSAYTYSYATLGELIAWIIGWDLILEYAVSNVAVAIGFGGYLKAQLGAFGLSIPEKWSTPVIDNGWTGSYFNLPAFLIVFILTVLLVWGIRESAEANNIMVVIKIGAILTFLVVGGMLANRGNLQPFAPSGFAGIISGGAIIFFTYIGFDSVSTAAEEARNPQKDIPFGIIASLIVCTVLYIGVALVLLGMMKYSTFSGGNMEAANAPVAYALQQLGANRIFQSVIIIGALMGMISSLLVFQYGQTRIWFAMSRDGLLPKLFSTVHPKFKTPHWSTWIAGAAVGIPAGLFSISEAADLSNIGTLFAFVLVSLGVLFLRRSQPERPRGFKVPFVPVFPIISVILCIALMAGLLVITWVRFFLWLGLGLIVFFSWSRYWSEFASPYFRSLRDEEAAKRAVLSAGEAQIYQSRRRSHGLAWTLCALLGFAGLHFYYIRKTVPAILRTALFAIIVFVSLVVPLGPYRLVIYLLFLILLVPYEIFWIVGATQEHNIGVIRQIATVSAT